MLISNYVSSNIIIFIRLFIMIHFRGILTQLTESYLSLCSKDFFSRFCKNNVHLVHLMLNSDKNPIVVPFGSECGENDDQLTRSRVLAYERRSSKR